MGPAPLPQTGPVWSVIEGGSTYNTGASKSAVTNHVVTQSDPWVTHSDPLMTQDDAWVNQGDPLVTQGDPLVTQSYP